MLAFSVCRFSTRHSAVGAVVGGQDPLPNLHEPPGSGRGESPQHTWVWLILHVGVASSSTALQVLMGYRLEKPRPCRQEVYEIMQRCWSSVSPSL